MTQQAPSSEKKTLVGGIEQRDYLPSEKVFSPLTGANQPLTPYNQQNYAPLSGSSDTYRALGAGIDKVARLGAGIVDKLLGSGEPLQDQAKLPPLPLNAGKTHLPGDLPQKELLKLGGYDLVIMQDRSSSMGEHEAYPQGYMPRWYWCLLQAMDLRRQTLALPNWTFNLVLFSSKYDIYRNVTMQQLPAVFDRKGIWIGTHLAPPVYETLDEYFRRRASGRARPLIIAVITDGKPKDEHSLADAIIEATRHMSNPNEIHITFLQVGTDNESYRKLEVLDNGLQSQGARFDIVSVMPFSQVTQLGLTRALLVAVQSARVRKY